MKLNKDLIREIALYIEENGNGDRPKRDLKIENYTTEEVKYHFMQMIDMGLVKGSVRSINGTILEYWNLTYKGHEFIENIRNQYIWDEIKRDIETKGIKDMSITLLKDFINSYIRNKFNF